MLSAEECEAIEAAIVRLREACRNAGLSPLAYGRVSDQLSALLGNNIARFPEVVNVFCEGLRLNPRSPARLVFIPPVKSSAVEPRVLAVDETTTAVIEW